MLKQPIQHQVNFSGGICSWAAAKRVVERHGAGNIVLLFADTKIEDPDLYRFLDEAAANIGAPLVKIADGRTPWDVMKDERIIGGGKTGADPCSKILKRRLLDAWHYSHAPNAITYLGLDWTERHRLDRLREKEPGRQWAAPMTEEPYITKDQMQEWLANEGIRLPLLYTLGFPHNNCGGFCVKAGQAQFALLLKTFPERFAHHEQKEREMQRYLGKDYSILTYKMRGQKFFLPLSELRRRVEQQLPLDMFDWGGCGCAVE